MNNIAEIFVRNAWYVAGHSQHVPQAGMLARTILNEPIVLYRDPQGNVAALEDRCCHRGAPLSAGRLVPQGIECGYHGLTYNGAGKCIIIPGQDSIPPQARVKSYPIVERQQLIWIWMGDPARADQSRIVERPHYDLPDLGQLHQDALHIKASYLMVIDNLMDLTHLGYVHTRTIGGDPKAHVDAKMTAEPTPNGARFTRWLLNSVPPPAYVMSAGFKGNVDRWQEFEFIAPGAVLQWTGAVEAGKDAYENRNQPGAHITQFHFATPETATTCHYYWSRRANGHLKDESEGAKQTYATFLEDRSMMEQQQERLNLDPDRPLVTIKSDRALTFARQAIHRLIEAERGITMQAAV